MSCKGHTATYRGKWVLVELHTGESFTDQFLERTGGKRLRFKKRGLVTAGDIARLVVSPKIRKALARGAGVSKDR